MVRLAHFSDIHITAVPLGWAPRDWFNKRLPGWVNYRWLGRAHRFRAADVVVAALVDDLRRRQPDRLVFSGDATAMGFEAEMARAAQLLQVNASDMPPGLAVPGNHDYYTRVSAAAGYFERYFAAWQTGERVDGATYPFAQRVGPVWLVAVNSCTGNRWAWDASGEVDAPQLKRLQALLARLGPGPRILVTHYPICLRSGRCERRTHGLRNLADLIAVAAAGGVGLWLHGHRHGAYYLSRAGAAPFPVVCVGSATQRGYWSYNEYAIDGPHVHAVSRRYVPEEGRFRDGETFDIKLRLGEEIHQ
jgi:3',5'-cyclic AMP phosphodiesterase CpdA